MDYELVKRLRERCVFLFPHHGESRSYDADLMHEAADAIEQLSAECDAYRKAMTDEHNRAAKLAWEKEHRWIPVVERLPKDDTICILTDGVSEAIGYRGKVFGWHLIWTDYLAESDITHWMPLPSTEGLNET